MVMSDKTVEALHTHTHTLLDMFYKQSKKKVT